MTTSILPHWTLGATVDPQSHPPPTQPSTGAEKKKETKNRTFTARFNPIVVPKSPTKKNIKLVARYEEVTSSPDISEQVPSVKKEMTIPETGKIRTKPQFMIGSAFWVNIRNELCYGQVKKQSYDVYGNFQYMISFKKTSNHSNVNKGSTLSHEQVDHFVQESPDVGDLWIPFTLYDNDFQKLSLQITFGGLLEYNHSRPSVKTKEQFVSNVRQIMLCKRHNVTAHGYLSLCPTTWLNDDVINL